MHDDMRLDERALAESNKKYMNLKSKLAKTSFGKSRSVLFDEVADHY